MTASIDASQFTIDRVPAGAITPSWIHLFDLDGWGAVELPVLIARGAEPGPLLFAVAGVHGNEYEGMAAIREVVAELDPSAMRGTFAAIITANPFAYASRIRESPSAIDGVNLAINLTGVFYAARAAARRMIPQGSGSIVTIGSINSFRPEGDVPAYAASKGGVLLLTRSLARDLAPYGIRVNGVAPGATATENILEAIRLRGWTNAEVSARIPIGRQASPDEIAAVALFLASDDASYVTGEMIVVDGGMLCN